MRTLFFSLLMLLFPVVAVHAAAPAAAEKEAPAAVAGTDVSAPKTVVETSHELLIGGKKLRYKARAGELLVEKEQGKPKGRFFFVAYELEGVADKAARPVTFAFNGGPGASSAWLHLGCMGPMRLAMHADGNTLPPPSRLVANEQTWLPFTDMVFIDPVGTGYSRSEPAGEKKDFKSDNKEFWGVDQDVSSVAAFIRLYLTRYERWLSPKFLAGESYGTTRAAALSRYLMERLGIALNGVSLLSPVLSFDTIQADGDLPFVLLLPSYAATAHAHGLGAYADLSLKEVEQKARDYASGPYLASLFKGTTLDAKGVAARNKQVADLIGLPQEEVSRLDAQVPVLYYLKNLLRKDRLLISRYDGTITGIDPYPADQWGMEYDPNLDVMSAAVTSAANAYYREALGFKSNEPYQVLNPEVIHTWDWSSGIHGGQGYVDTADDLAVALAANQALHVFIACGCYDMATPSFAAEYTLGHMELAPSVLQRVDLRKYEGGHMFYAHEQARERFTSDIRKFYADAVASAQLKPTQ